MGKKSNSATKKSRGPTDKSKKRKGKQANGPVPAKDLLEPEALPPDLPEIGARKPETFLESGFSKVKAFFKFSSRTPGTVVAPSSDPLEAPTPRLPSNAATSVEEEPATESENTETKTVPASFITPGDTTVETAIEQDQSSLEPCEAPEDSTTEQLEAKALPPAQSEVPLESPDQLSSPGPVSDPEAQEGIASPKSIRESKKSSVRWQSAAARLTGLSHWRSDLPCQDFAFARCKPRPLAIACDGRGSSARSELGSRAITETTHRVVLEAQLLLTRLLDQDTGELHRPLLGIFLDLISRAWAGALEDVADQEQIDDKDVETTANIVIVGQLQTLLLQVGDGAIVGIQDSGAQRLIAPTRGEYASETVFVTTQPLRPDALQYRLVPSEPWRGFAAMTDGVSDSLVRHSDGCADGLAQFLSKTLAPAEDRKKAALDLLLDPRVFPTRFTDDRSLAIVFKSSGTDR